MITEYSYLMTNCCEVMTEYDQVMPVIAWFLASCIVHLEQATLT